METEKAKFLLVGVIMVVVVVAVGIVVAVEIKCVVIVLSQDYRSFRCQLTEPLICKCITFTIEN